MNNQPLVSICVFAYNSSQYIRETLESAKEQTYKNIELVVSDDCSTDDTVDVCKKWVDDNNQYFVNCKIVTAPVNTGIAANCNRAINVARGEWIKTIAGDDILLPNCIEDNIKFVTNNEFIQVLFSNYNILIDGQNKHIVEHTFKPDVLDFFKLPTRRQFERLVRGNILPAMTSFVAAPVYRKYKFNEMYKFLEDIPMWVQLTKNGIHIDYMDSITALYRSHESLSNSSIHYFSPKFVESSRLYFWNERSRYMLENGMTDVYNSYRQGFLCQDIAESLLHNRISRFHNIIYCVLCWIVKRVLKFT